MGEDLALVPTVAYPYVYDQGWSFWKTVDIPDKEYPHLTYLRRFIVFKTPYCALYLHRIYMPDGDRDPHNHPFGFLSVVLRGGYTEERHGFAPRVRRWGSLAITRLKDFHFIRLLARRPTITLVLCGPRQQEWGFMTDEGFVPHSDYID